MNKSKKFRTIEYPIQNTKLYNRLNSFLKFNKSDYLFSNSQTNEFYHSADQIFTLAIFTMIVLQVMLCVLIKEKDEMVEYAQDDLERKCYQWICMLISPLNFTFCIIKYKYRFMFSIKKGELYHNEYPR